MENIENYTQTGIEKYYNLSWNGKREYTSVNMYIETGRGKILYM